MQVRRYFAVLAFLATVACSCLLAQPRVVLISLKKSDSTGSLQTQPEINDVSHPLGRKIARCLTLRNATTVCGEYVRYSFGLHSKANGRQAMPEQGSVQFAVFFFISVCSVTRGCLIQSTNLTIPRSANEKHVGDVSGVVLVLDNANPELFYLKINGFLNSNQRQYGSALVVY